MRQIIAEFPATEVQIVDCPEGTAYGYNMIVPMKLKLSNVAEICDIAMRALADKLGEDIKRAEPDFVIKHIKQLKGSYVVVLGQGEDNL